MRKFFYHIHLWLSIPLGIIITIICLSGAILVFQNNINECLHHSRYYADDITSAFIPLNKLIPIVNRQLGDNGKVVSVEIPSDPKKNYVMGLPKGFMTSAYVNPYNGKLIDIVSLSDGFFGVVRQLHKCLLDSSGVVGKAVVGYTTLFFVFILISGIVLWLPRSKKSLKTQLSIHTKYGWKRFWTDLHLRGGIYVCIGLLVLSLTGLTFAFDWYQKGLFSLLGAKTINKNEGGKEQSEDINYTFWPTAVNTVKQKYSDFKTIKVQDGSVSVTPNFTFGNMRYSDKYVFDANNGNIVKSVLYKNQDKQGKVSGWIFSLHTGNWGGILSKILTFIVALIGACLPVIGYYLYFKKRKRKNDTRIREL